VIQLSTPPSSAATDHRPKEAEVSNTDSPISPVVDVADKRSHRLRARTLDTTLDDIGPNGRVAQVAARSGRIEAYEEFAGYPKYRQWPVDTEHVVVVAFPEGHVYGRLSDRRVWDPVDCDLPGNSRTWRPFVDARTAEWAAKRLGLADGTWSVAAERCYHDRGVDAGWREVHITPAGAAELEALGVTAERFAAKLNWVVWSAHSAEVVARRIARLEREDMVAARREQRNGEEVGISA